MSAKVMIGLPTARRVHLETLATLHQMIRSTREAVEVRVVQLPGSPVDAVRNKLVDQFLQMPDYTHLLFVDSDMSFPSNGLDNLLRLDGPISVAIVPILRSRQSRIDGSERLNLSTTVGEYAGDRHRELPPDPGAEGVMYRWLDLFELDTEPVMCDAAGSGFMLIRRDVLETIEAPWFRVNIDREYHIISEDIYFCRKAAQKGFSIVADPTVLCDHFKLFDLSRLEELFTDEQTQWPWAEGPIAPPPAARPSVMIGTVGAEETLNVDVSDFVYQQLTNPAACVSKVSYNHGSGLVRTCNRMFEEFLDQSSCSHLLVHADNVGVRPDFLVRALATGVPVAGACCRTLQGNGIVYEAGTMDDYGRVTPLEEIDAERRDGPSEVDFVGLSATLFAREALAPLSRPILPAAESLVDAAAHLCRRLANEAGVRPTLLPIPCHSYATIGLKPLIELRRSLREKALAAL